jgi:leucine dehydrogenase
VSVYESSDYDRHERVVFHRDPETGMRAIIAIHNSNLGPALGGCRMWAYESEAAAVRDVLRLSRGMTYKAAIAGVELGGGKSVIIGDPHHDKSPEILHAMGRFIETLNGRYITGEDIGTNVYDMAEIKTETRYVTCLRKEDGGYGDPAPMTALGVFLAMRAGIEARLDRSDYDGLKVAVQGVGNVGFNLCRLLTDAGARLTVADVYEPNLQRAVDTLGAAVVAPDAIYEVDADVFSPCAMGGTLNNETILRLKAKVVAGAANNQLGEPEHGALLSGRQITYLPDYVANGGGLVCVAAEWYRHDESQVEANVNRIYGTCVEILGRASTLGIPTSEAADRIAEERFHPHPKVN